MSHRFEPSIFWELPLAVLSFLFFKTVRLLIALIFPIHHLLAKRQLDWKYATAELFRKPLVLPLIMTTGPRWNTHAIVGTVGPINIKQSLKVDLAAVRRSARVWTIVVCTFPGYKPLSTIGSKDHAFNGSVADVPVKPGKYSIAVRYYHCSRDVEFPALTVDGVALVHSAPVPSTLNDVYYSLAATSSRFYLFLHYYVFVLLRYRQYFPTAFVEQEFLPSGNPETHFYFGALRADEKLSMSISPEILSSYDVYLTIYNRASFPLHWCQVTQTEFVSAESTVDTMYLVRAHPSKPVSDDFPRDRIQVAVRLVR